MVHHINPITADDIENWNEDVLLNSDNLICVSKDTHNKIHYGYSDSAVHIERSPNDTRLW